MNDDWKMTVILPPPGRECHKGNGAQVLTPKGEDLPGVTDVQINAPAGKYVTATLTCLVRVIQLEEESER